MHVTGTVVLFLIFACYVQNVDSEVFNSEFEQKLDQFVQTTMDCRLVPGLTLAVVKENETWTKGYGFADIDTSRPVTKDTLFNIGSVTKSMTMALLGVLLTEKKMKWTTKVQDILGSEYRFPDDYRTEEMTLKDLLAHRTGFARLDIGYTAGFPENLSRAEFAKYCKFFNDPENKNLLKTLREKEKCWLMKHIPISKPFRDSFLYNNYMYMYLGHICEVLGGDTYENLLRDRLLKPLGMASTKLIKTTSDVQFGDVAKPYNHKDGKFQNGTYGMYVLYPLEPIGSVLSSGEDMIKWMQFLIQNGKLSNGTELVDTKLMKKAFRARITFKPSNIGYFKKPQWPIQMTPMGYGYALFISTYRGYELISHSGYLFSYLTRMFVYPDLKTGVFVSTNGPGIVHLSSMTTRTVVYFTSDGALGLDPWLNDTTTCTYPHPWFMDKPRSDESNKTKLNITNPSEYAGFYEHHFLPGINVSVIDDDNTKLGYTMGRTSGLLHSTATVDTFEMALLHPREMIKNNETVTFTIVFGKENGHVTNLTAEYEVDVTYTRTNQGSAVSSGPLCYELPIAVLCLVGILFQFFCFE